LISPSAGAHLLSSAITGMRHDDLAVSPAGGSFSSPNFFYSGGVASIDWAGQNPLFIATVGVPRSSIASTSPCNWGGFSTDGGTTWTPFNGCAANAATALNNPGTLVVDASGTVMMWTPPGSINTAQYSNDGSGGIWSPTSGFLPHLTPVADKVAPRTFYAFDGITFFSTAASGGSSFAKVNTAAFQRGMGPLVPVVNFARAGDIWLPAGGFGLFHSTNGGITWTAISTMIQANQVTVGAANPRSRTQVQSVFVYGVPNANSVYAIYRSDDNGATWVQVNDAAHQYGGPAAIAADTRVYGRIYVGTNGRGIVYGDIPTELLGTGGVRPQ
jgi:oligoxyloglucan reducing-end-specific cellobiohydrolase